MADNKSPPEMTYLGGIALHPDFDFAKELLKGKIGEKHVALLREEAERAYADNVDPNELHQRLLAVSRRYVRDLSEPTDRQ